MLDGLVLMSLLHGFFLAFSGSCRRRVIFKGIWRGRFGLWLRGAILGAERALVCGRWRGRCTQEADSGRSVLIFSYGFFFLAFGFLLVGQRSFWPSLGVLAR